jgi:hypothetical protein
MVHAVNDRDAGNMNGIVRMKTSTLVAIPLMLGLGVLNVADAANGYQAPSRWDHFHPSTKPARIAQAPSKSERSVLIKGPPPTNPARQPRTPETIPMPPSANGATRNQQGAVAPGNPAIQPGNPAIQPGNRAVQPSNRAVQPGNRAVQPDNRLVPPGNAVLPPSSVTPPTADAKSGNAIVPPGDSLAPQWNNAILPPGNAAPPADNGANPPGGLLTPPNNGTSSGKRRVMPNDPVGSPGREVIPLPPGVGTPQPGNGFVAPGYGVGSEIVIPGSEVVMSPDGLVGTNAGPYGLPITGPADCCPVRLPMKRWFGSSNLVFYSLNSSDNRYVATGLGSYTTAEVDPGSSVGIDLSFGRYLKCGLFGLGATLFVWDPGSDQEVRLGTSGTIRASMPAYHGISVDAGSGVETVYDIIDGVGAYAGASAVRIDRDMRLLGFELNLFSFGLMGARRISYLTPCASPEGCATAGGCATPGGCASLQGVGRPKNALGFRYGKECYGHGGASGPLVRPECGRVRVMTSHGFRWLQIHDSFEYAYNTDGAGGYQATDLFEESEVENNLVGYQFGGRLTYCLNGRMNLNVGAKCGIYSNSARVRHRVGTGLATAYLNGAPASIVVTSSTDQSMATLGELDIGIGCRLGCAWTVRFGYRALGVGGVVTSVGALPDNYATIATSGQVHANDSLLLNGVYFGTEFNW